MKYLLPIVVIVVVFIVLRLCVRRVTVLEYEKGLKKLEWGRILLVCNFSRVVFSV